MIVVTIDNKIKDNEELLYYFQDKYKANTNVIIDNKTPIVRMIERNPVLLSLINTFDMVVE